MQQEKHCVFVIRKTKREYGSNIEEKNICDNKAFKKLGKPILSKKINSNEKITLIENDEIIKF